MIPGKVKQLSQFVTYRAACPGCGADVLWTSTSATVTKEENRFVIDCEDCNSKEQEWQEKQRVERLTRTVAEAAKRAMKIRAALPSGTASVPPVTAGSPGNS